MNNIPLPDVISGYEKLGIVGILVFVLFVGLIVIVWAVRQLKGVAKDFITYVTHQTTALTQVKESLDQQRDIDTRLHERLDNLLSCARSGCPVFEMRKKMQKEAAREAAGNPVPSTPPQPAT